MFISTAYGPMCPPKWRSGHNTRRRVWSPDVLPLDGKPYRVLRVDRSELSGLNLFRLVAQGLSKDRDMMARTTISGRGNDIRSGT